MEQEGLNIVASQAAKKYAFFKNWRRYGLYAMMAGCFCSIGMAFAYSAGTGFYASLGVQGLYKLAIGFTFALSFTLITFAGAELFTGNVLVMTVGTLCKTVSLGDTVRLLSFCYCANVLGAILMGCVISGTGLLSGSMGELLLTTCIGKTSLPFIQALFRGILCNILVCLGTWMSAKLKSEVAKMMALAWVVVGFAATGYEHSIANAGMFTMAAFAPDGNAIHFAGILSNMVPVTIGNIIGGALFVGFVYWYAGRDADGTLA